MKILLTKIDEQRHALRVIRADGTEDRVELETKSTLVHDFLHFALETEAELADGFWGSLASGVTFAQLKTGAVAMTGAHESSEGVGVESRLPQIEPIMGALSMSVKGRTAAQMMDSFTDFFRAQDKPFPVWLTEDLINRIQERMRRLLGHWQGTPFGSPMELVWPE